jgi:hypothetical protein
MKKFLFLLALLAAHEAVNAQKGTFIWTDTTTNYVNHRIISLIQHKNELFALSKSQDINFQNPHPSFSRISLDGKVQNFTVYSNVGNLYELNAIVAQPDGNIRIYGTVNEGGKFVPYINSVTAKGDMPMTTTTMVNVPHYVGDAKQVNQNDVVWTKAIRGSQTGRYNAFAYRVNMAKGDAQVWRTPLTSELNEESAKLVVLPDTSVLLLCKRYVDETFLSFTSVIYKIDPKGALLWSKELTDYTDFTNQNLTADANFIYYTNSNGDEKSGLSQGNLLKLDQKGELVKRVAIENMNPTGALLLKSGKVLVYGGVYKPEGIQFIKRAKVLLFDDKGMQLKERTMEVWDKPDSDLPSMAISMKPTSTDFLTAIQLTDGRVALAGRVYMPMQVHPNKIMLSARANRNLLVIAGDDGLWEGLLDKK